MTKKIGAIALATALGIAFVFTGCGGGQAVRTDHLIIGTAAMPANMDSTLANDIPSSRIIFHVFDTLIYTDYDMEPQPNLATSWEWVDPANPTALRVFLRQGVLFHNGDELRASDVVFSMNRASVAPAIAGLAGVIDHAVAVSDYEVIIHLEEPFVPFINALGHTAFSIFNERAVTEMGVDAHSQAPIGTGPYRFVNLVTGDRVELTRWDQYWGTPAIIENVTIRVLADASTRLIALETGEIDIMDAVPPQDMSRVRGHPDLTLHHEMSLGVNYIAFNTSRPPFDDIRVRHAVQYAIDLEAMVQAVYLGALESLRGPINPRVWGSTADRLEPFPFNPDRARELLAEAGFPNGFSATFMTNQGNPARADTGEIMQNMLGAVGIDLSVQLLEWATFLDVTAQGEPDMFMLGWVTSTGDPDYGMWSMFHSSAHGAAGNRGFFSDPIVDSLLEAGRRETNPAARLAIYEELQQHLRDESPWIFQSAGAELWGVRNNIHGFRIAPTQRHKFWTLTMN
ncbi:MAG: ABC transporter substrate-binding protein [Spirochaetes bacterium]|nr:ABC transporter substrate-binding protein [Spirochaetota bacterium]